jgi:hypothetical protein
MFLRWQTCAGGLQKMADWRDELADIVGCELCDDEGIHLNGIHKCDHVDYAAIAKRGMAKVKAALKGV